MLAAKLYDEIPHLRRRAAPGFSDLARRIVDVWAPQAGPGGEISRLLRDFGRFAAGSWALYLEATPGGLTISRMSETLKGTTISGPGRARAILTYMRFIGYVEPAPNEGDGRDRRYRTTETMQKAFRERVRGELAARADQDPTVAEVLADFDHLFIDYLVVLSEVSLATLQQPAKLGGEVDLFSERYAGMVILCELMRSGEPDDSFPPSGPLTFTVAELARRCDTSRMQVNSLLKRARAAGVLLPAGDGRERLSEALLDNFRTLVAGSTDMLVGCARILVHGSPTFFDDESPSARG
ncbi:MAG: hypothetical protein KA105_01240 [Caulobacter sp.]|nr:hypothetical protein [Caulobacter sp.]